MIFMGNDPRLKVNDKTADKRGDSHDRWFSVAFLPLRVLPNSLAVYKICTYAADNRLRKGEWARCFFERYYAREIVRETIEGG